MCYPQFQDKFAHASHYYNIIVDYEITPVATPVGGGTTAKGLPELLQVVIAILLIVSFLFLVVCVTMTVCMWQKRYKRRMVSQYIILYIPNLHVHVHTCTCRTVKVSELF